MSYFIKTPHTIFEVVGENDRVYFVKAKGNPNNTYSKSKCQTVVFQKANTIEELCDDFYLVVYDALANKKVRISFENFNSAKTHCDRYFKNYDWSIYGAIWTDKGLIYVAKMNDKGIIELL